MQARLFGLAAAGAVLLTLADGLVPPATAKAGELAFVTNQTDKMVSVVDEGTLAVAGTIKVDERQRSFGNLVARQPDP